MRKAPPNKDYMLNLLFTFNPEHPVFAKDYVKPRPAEKGVVDFNVAQVRNDDGFYDGLPIYTGSGSKRARLLDLAVYPLSRDEARLAKLRWKMEQIEASISVISGRVQDAHNANRISGNLG